MLNEKLIAKSFRSLMTMTIFAGIVAMAGSFIDGLVIGNFLGASDMAAFGYASPIFMLIAAMAGIFANGGKAICSALIGEGKYEQAQENFMLSCISSLVLGGVITAICVVAAGPIARLMGASPELAGATADYIRGIGVGAIPIMLMQVVTSYISIDNGEGLGFVAAIVMSMVNVALDFSVALIFHGGLFGMGLATSISYLLALASQLIYFRRKERLFVLRKPSFSAEKLRAIFNTGMPSAVSRVSFSVANVLINRMLFASGGEMAVSAYSVQSTVNMFISAVFMGVSSSVSIFSGLFYGERNRTALRCSSRVAMRCGLVMSVALGAILLVAAAPLSAMMLKADAATLEITATSLRFLAVSLPTEILTLVLIYHYLSTEKVWLANVVCALHNLVLLVLPAAVLRPFIGLNGIWLSALLSGVLLVPCLLPLLKRYKGGSALDMWLAICDDFEPAQQKVFERSFTNDMAQVMQVIDEARQFCLSAGATADRARRICLSLEEMAGNIASHGFAAKGRGLIDLRIVLSGEECRISLRDNGRRFNPLSYENREEQYGIRLIRGISRSIDYRYAVGMNNLSISI